MTKTFLDVNDYQLVYCKTNESFDLAKLIFANTIPTNVTGDDWDDAPYEHNGSEPYDRTDKKPLKTKTIIVEGYLLKAPNYNHLNSPYSIDDINHSNRIPWLEIETFNNDSLKLYPGVTLGDTKKLIKSQNNLTNNTIKIYIEERI